MTKPDTNSLLRQRLVRGTLRSVWVEDGQLVKEYRRLKWPGDTRRPWAREHKALLRLKQRGVPAPASFGLESGGRGIVRHRREFIPGEILQEIRTDRLGDLAAHVAAVHAAGVVNDDAALDNLLIGRDGRCMCIDYGRSRVFVFGSPLFYFYVGKELGRMRRNVVNRNAEQWAAFSRGYRKAARYPGWGWAVARASWRYWLRRWRVAAADGDGLSV